MPMPSRPRRSALYMPGSNERAVAKGRELDTDVIILDLEDAVAPSAKARAREVLTDALQDKPAYGRREIVIRINGLATEWGENDLSAMATVGADAILVPKVESADQVDEVASRLEPIAAEIAIWCMIETPRGVLRVEEIADHPKVACLVMGTSDLTKDLGARHCDDRTPMLTSLSRCVLAARAAGCAILDGVHLNLGDDEGLKRSCEQGRDLGFDGKTLIHPRQLSAANDAFGPSDEEIAWSRRIIEEWEKAGDAGVVVVDGRLVENLHIEQARRLLDVHAAITRRSAQ